MSLTDARGEKSGEERVVRVEAVDGLLPLVARHAPVEALHGEAAPLAELLQQVQHADHLREDEHLVVLPPQRGQELVDQHHLARGRHQPALHALPLQLRGVRDARLDELLPAVLVYFCLELLF